MLYSTPLYQKLHRKEINKLKSEQVTELYQVIDQYYPHLTTTIIEKHKNLTKNDVILCYLMKLELPASYIAQLLCRTRSAICEQQKRVAKKLLGEDATTKDLQIFLD